MVDPHLLFGFGGFLSRNFFFLCDGLLLHHLSSANGDLSSCKGAPAGVHGAGDVLAGILSHCVLDFDLVAAILGGYLHTGVAGQWLAVSEPRDLRFRYGCK